VKSDDRLEERKLAVSLRRLQLAEALVKRHSTPHDEVVALFALLSIVHALDLVLRNHQFAASRGSFPINGTKGIAGRKFA